MTQDEGQPTVSDVIAARVREVRRRRGWNTATLAEHCAETGAEWLTDGVIRNIEHGRPRNGKRTRDITADEVVALARALGTLPAVLMPELGQGPGDLDMKLFSDVDEAIGDLQAAKDRILDGMRRWAAEAAQQRDGADSESH